jgi:putative oxidoreductase
MDRILNRFSELFYALMRLAVGLLFACHGLQKLFGLFGGPTVQLGSLMGLAGTIELVGGAMIALGLLTSWAAFVASGEMAVAFFKVHFHNGIWPIQNGGELAVAYCFVFLYIAARGSGRFSLDALLGRGLPAPVGRR